MKVRIIENVGETTPEALCSFGKWDTLSRQFRRFAKQFLEGDFLRGRIEQVSDTAI